MDFITLLHLSPHQNRSSNALSVRGVFLDFDILCSTVIILTDLAGFFFKSSFFVPPLLDSTLNIQLGISPPWLSSSLLLPPPQWSSLSSSLVFNVPVWVWQYLACTSHVTNYLRVNGGDDTHHFANVLCSTGNPGKHWPTSHQSVWSTICS